MTVGELIRSLSDFPLGQEVYFAHPSHDYWRSELASEVESVDEESIKYSQYHGQMCTVKQNENEESEVRTDDVSDDSRVVVVLR